MDLGYKEKIIAPDINNNNTKLIELYISSSLLNKFYVLTV